MPFFLIAPLTWLSNLGFSVIAWVFTRLGIKFVAGVTIIGLAGAAAASFIGEIDTLLGSIFPGAASFIIPFVPSNLGLCVSLVVSTELVCTGYKLTLRFIEWKSRILLA